ncbi:MAG: PAS domain S-box protein [Nitrosomonadales bacterium]|nr:PAS domain S-box protein [Nitrosomonadales bacterium]
MMVISESKNIPIVGGSDDDCMAAHAQREQPRRMQQENEELLHKLSERETELEMQNDELRRAQAAMAESRDRYADLYDFAPIGYLTLTREASISEINLTGAALLGKERDDLIRSRFARLVAPEDGDRWHLHFMSTLQHGAQQSCELMLRRDDGSRFHARLDCLRLISDGNVPAVRITLSDITRRKQAEASLRRHKLVIDAAIDGFWMTDVMGNLQETNEAYAKMSGYTVDELVGMHVSQLEAIEQSPEEVHAHIAKVIAQGYDRFETRHRHKDRHEIDIEVSVAYMAESQQLFAFCRDITERKQAEEELRVAAEAFETQDAIMITDADGNIIRVNRAFSAITGYSPEDVLGKKQDVMNRGQHDDISCIGMLQQSIRDDLWTGEVWDKRKNGQIYPKWLTVTAVKNERYETTHYVIIFNDITARKQIEKENLRESDDRFRGTLEQAAVGITHTSLDGHFRQANQKFCNLVGYTRDELMQMSSHDITFPDDLAEQDRRFRQLLAGEISTFSMEIRYIRKDRSLALVNLTVSLLRNAGGTPKFTIGVVEDIAERKQAELLAQQFGHLLQGSFNEIYLFDADSLYFLLTSEGAEKNLGYSDDELNQLTPLDLEPSFTRESFEQMIAPLRSGEQRSLFFETVHRRKDGTTYPVEVRLQFMQAEHPVFLAIVQDITARKQSEMEINQSRQLLRDLVAQGEAFREEERKCLAREVHDELGQTLTALRMNVSLLRIEFCGNNAALLERVERITGLLDQSIQCTRDVVNNLRPVALDMGIIPAIRWLCDEFNKNTGASCVVYAPEEEIHLDELVAVAAFRIAQESLTNVARYAGASKVEIIIRQDTDNFSVTVNDNGKGFDYMDTPDHKSFGLLGMRERAIALGGVVNIYSTPQRGTQVSFTVPNTRTLTDTEGSQP